MQTFVSSNFRNGRLRLPPALLECIRSELSGSAHGRIRRGDLTGFPIKGAKGNGELWVWDLTTLELPSNPEALLASIPSPELIPLIAHSLHRHPRGFLLGPLDIPTPLFPGVSSVKGWVTLPMDLPADGDLHKATSDGISLSELLNRSFGIRNWQPPAFLGGGVALLHADGSTEPVSSIRVNIGALSNISHSSTLQPSLAAAEVLLMYMQAPLSVPLPTPDVLSVLGALDACLASDVVFGTPPHAHLFEASIPDAQGKTQVSVWRMVGDVNSTRSAIAPINRVLSRWQANGRFDFGKWRALFETFVQGRILEEVPLENAETGERVTHLQI